MQCTSGKCTHRSMLFETQPVFAPVKLLLTQKHKVQFVFLASLPLCCTDSMSQASVSEVMQLPLSTSVSEVALF